MWKGRMYELMDEETNPVEAPVTEEPTAQAVEESEQSETTAEIEATWEKQDDGTYLWSDGVRTDENGEEIPETAPVAVTPEPKPAPKSTPKPEPRGEAQQKPFYTREATKAAIYSDEALTKISDIALVDPIQAERMRADLSEQYQDALRRLDRHASEVFEREMEDLERDAPQAVRELATQIQRHKSQLSPEELQTPGTAKFVLAQAVTRSIFSQDALGIEESYLRAKGNAPASAPTVAPKPTPQKRVIAPADRTPGPGAARRAEPVRRAEPGKNSRDPLADHYMQMYGGNGTFTYEEAKAMADDIRKQDTERLRQRT